VEKRLVRVVEKGLEVLYDFVMSVCLESTKVSLLRMLKSKLINYVMSGIIHLPKGKKKEEVEIE